MDPAEAVEYIRYKLRKRVDDLIFQRWIAGPQYEMSLEEFKHRLRPARVRSEEEILNEVYAAFEKAGIE